MFKLARCFVFACFGLPLSVVAAEPLALRGDPAACPSPSQLTNAIRNAWPELVLADEPDALNVEIRDLGSSFTIEAQGQTRTFTDETRDCSERARKASVFVLLLVQPTPAAPPAPTPAATSAPTVRRYAPTLQLDLGGVVSGAPAAGATTIGGGVLRLFVGGRYVGAVLGVTGVSPTTLALNGARVKMVRVPIDLGLRARVFVWRLVLAAELALSVGPQITDGLDVLAPVHQVRVEVGLGATVRGEIELTRRLSAFASVSAIGFPRPYDLVSNAQVVLGTTPRAWLSGAAGLSLRFR